MTERAPAGELDVSLVGIVNVILRHRWSFVWIPFVVFVGVVGITLLLPRTYTAEARFMPQPAGGGAAGALSGLAAQLGFAVPAAEIGQSPEFYAELMQDREILAPTVAAEYRVAGGEGSPRRGTLVDFFEIDASDSAVARTLAIRELRDHLRIRVRRETGVIEVGVRSKWPDLSQQVLDRLLALINEFNIATRRTQAGAERAFIEARLEEANEALAESEEALQAFLDVNRAFRNSPQLALEHDRLQREVLYRQQIATTLAQSYEQARIEEVRNTPLITVIAAPEIPAEPDRRRLLFRGSVALLAGFLLAAAMAFARELVRAARQADPVAYQELVTLREQTVDDVRRLVQRGPRDDRD